jgi:hypothetical protein
MMAFLNGTQAGMDQEVMRGGRQAEEILSYQQAFVAAYSGHLQQLRLFSQRASDLAEHSGGPEAAALYQAGAAIPEAFVGNTAGARQMALAALQLARDREVEFGAAVVLALQGDLIRSQSLIDDLDRRFPEDLGKIHLFADPARAAIAPSRRTSKGP